MYNKELRVIKVAAVALIVFPEPITTLIGLAILVTVNFLSRTLNRRIKEVQELRLQ